MKEIGRIILRVAKIIESLSEDGRQQIARMICESYSGHARSTLSSMAREQRVLAGRSRAAKAQRAAGSFTSGKPSGPLVPLPAESPAVPLVMNGCSLSDSPSLLLLDSLDSKAVESASKSRKSKRNVTNSSPGFELFWSAYPRRIAPDDAFRAWVKHDCESIAKEIVIAVEKQTPFLMRSDKDTKPGHYCPYPATWLNAGRWKDDLSLPAVKEPTWRGLDLR